MYDTEIFLENEIVSYFRIRLKITSNRVLTTKPLKASISLLKTNQLILLALEQLETFHLPAHVGENEASKDPGL